MRVLLYSSLFFALGLFADAYAQTEILHVNPDRCHWAHMDAGAPRAVLSHGRCSGRVECGSVRATIACSPVRRSDRTECPPPGACMKQFQKSENARLARSSTRTSGGEEAADLVGPRPAPGTAPAGSAGDASDPFQHGIPGDTHGY